MRDIRRGLWLMAIGITLFVAVQLMAEPGDVRGGYFEYSWSQGKFRWEPFLKIAAEKQYASESGEPEIWGFRPWNLEPLDEKGLTHPVNVIAASFVPCDGRQHKVTIRHPHEPDREVERWVKCPDILWNQQQASAVQ